MYSEEIQVYLKESKPVILIPTIIKIFDDAGGLPKGTGTVKICSKGISDGKLYAIDEKSNIEFSLESLIASGPIPYSQGADGGYSKTVDPVELLSMIAGAVDKAYRGEYLKQEAESDGA